MQWILCSMMECSGFYAAWPKASRLNAVDSMQRHWMQRIPCIVAQWILIACSGVHAARPNHPDWMLWIIWSMAQIIPIECSGFHAAWLNAVYSMQCEEKVHYWMQWILCSMIECSRFHAAWLMQWIICSMAQNIPIECSGFHAASLNAEDSMHCCAMDPDFMQWSPCSEAKCILIECSGF